MSNTLILGANYVSTSFLYLVSVVPPLSYVIRQSFKIKSTGLKWIGAVLPYQVCSHEECSSVGVGNELFVRSYANRHGLLGVLFLLLVQIYTFDLDL